jgi:hypothetical protein
LRGKRSRDDVLLGENTLDDAGRTTNALKEARVRSNHIQLNARESTSSRVLDLEVELEGKVAYQ